MRIVGPNCLGVVSTAVGLNATFMRRARAGSIAIASQSGGVGVVIADEAARRDLGVSAFVSMGNKVDVSGNDLLRYWADDTSTRVVLMYLESIGDPRRFARIARTVSKRMPLVALKGGRSAAGQRGAHSHTAALAADDAGIDALFAHTGVIRAATLDQLLDVGALLAAQPAPAGRRVALIGNAGGPLILAADAASANGLDVVELSGALQRRVRQVVPDAASTSNPVDLLATVTPAGLRDVLETVAESGEVDACVIVRVDLAHEGGATWSSTGPIRRYRPSSCCWAVRRPWARCRGMRRPSVPSTHSPWRLPAAHGWRRPSTTRSRSKASTSCRCAAEPVSSPRSPDEHGWSRPTRSGCWPTWAFPWRRGGSRRPPPNASATLDSSASRACSRPT